MGAPADLTLIDPDREWSVNPSAFHSKGKNTPLEGVSLKGSVVATYVAGVRVHSSVLRSELLPDAKDRGPTLKHSGTCPQEPLIPY